MDEVDNRSPPTTVRAVLRIMVVLLVLVGSPVLAAEDPGGAAQLHAKAQSAMQDKRYTDAAELFHAAYVLDNAPELLWNEARARHMAGALEKARELYKQFIERDDAPAALRGRANDSIVEITLELDKQKVVVPPKIVQHDDTFGTVMVAAGGVLVVGGAIAHIVSFAAADDMSTYARPVVGLDEVTRKQRYEDASDQKDTALALAWVGYGVGAAALVTGIVSLILTDDPDTVAVRPLLGPGNAGVGATLRF